MNTHLRDAEAADRRRPAGRRRSRRGPPCSPELPEPPSPPVMNPLNSLAGRVVERPRAKLAVKVPCGSASARSSRYLPWTQFLYSMAFWTSRFCARGDRRAPGPASAPSRPARRGRRLRPARPASASDRRGRGADDRGAAPACADAGCGDGRDQQRHRHGAPCPRPRRTSSARSSQAATSSRIV
ncbi:MAG: hypothetical protein MZV63_18045 [Marinilabiliales bacterium]|nr:hypothetical protein [Marinilabiliales bacterium]